MISTRHFPWRIVGVWCLQLTAGALCMLSLHLSSVWLFLVGLGAFLFIPWKFPDCFGPPGHVPRAHDVNPATGLPMVDDFVDVAGNTKYTGSPPGGHHPFNPDVPAGEPARRTPP